MKLSIIIPTFNRARLLAEAVESILIQFPPVYEIVIADDASNDETQFLCAKWQQIESPTRLIVARNEKNLGAQVSRNRGIVRSTGDYIFFMDSDDVLAENAIFPLLSKLEEDINLDYVYGQVVIVDSKLQPINNLNPIGSNFSGIPKDIAGYHWHTMGAIYRRSYLQKVGFWNEELTGSQDWEFQARVKIAGGKGQFIKHLVGLWREHSAERVGTKTFRYDYIQSVIHSCIAIRDKAHEMNLLDSALELRLVGKILIHSMEFSEKGYYSERNRGFEYALQTLDKNIFLKWMIYVWSILPYCCDRFAFRILQSLRSL
ncbi:glycosyl transferase, group 2 family protein [Calothrix sp. NIES-2100]|uniref:glycosyltransferase family 2 protein n=1 Tax=Calothrix sp. NIES-2100 TaxID=1954172 RepID=UPI000B5F7C8D|nr:glycosyl transferase, group 2 family protein [Calothrix sp. NIES-2100]